MKKRRRVRTEPVPGSDPTPGKHPQLGHEDERVDPEESSQGQKRDKKWYREQEPPHWGRKL